MDQFKLPTIVFLRGRVSFPGEYPLETTNAVRFVEVFVDFDGSGSKVGPFSELVPSLQSWDPNFFRKKMSVVEVEQKWHWKHFAAWWMKIQSFGRVERDFFFPLSKSVSPQQKELVFWGAKVQKAHVPAMIDQIWAGCVRCGEHATLACVLRNSQLHNSWIFVKGYTQWHCRSSSGVTKCIRACSEAIHSHLSYLFGVLSDQCLAGSRVLLVSCSTFSRRRVGAFHRVNA